MSERDREWLPREKWLKLHNEYLRSAAWRNLRADVLHRDEYACQMCLKARATHVHHLTYKRWRKEKPFDLVSLCDACHETQHSHMTPRVSPATTYRCDVCGKEWDVSNRELAHRLFLTMWKRHEDAETGPREHVLRVEVICNGRGTTCRQNRAIELEELHGRDVIGGDLPVDMFMGAAALPMLARYVPNKQWEPEALEDLLVIVNDLARMPTLYAATIEDALGIDTTPDDDRRAGVDS